MTALLGYDKHWVGNMAEAVSPTIRQTRTSVDQTSNVRVSVKLHKYQKNELFGFQQVYHGLSHGRG